MLNVYGKVMTTRLESGYVTYSWALYKGRVRICQSNKSFKTRIAAENSFWSMLDDLHVVVYIDLR